MSGGGGVADRIVPLLEQGRWDEAEEALSEVGKSGLAPEEREIWFRLWGISAYRRGDRGEARRRFAEGHEAFPASGDIAFSYAQEQLHAGDIDQAFALFRRHPFPAVSSAHAMAIARYAYLWSRPEDGIKVLMPVWEHMERLGIADPTFLVIRGLPMFESLWSALGALHEEREALEDFRLLTERFSQKITDGDFPFLFAQLEGIQSGGWTPYLGILRDRIAANRAEGHASGRLEIQAAILESRRCENWRAGSEVLRSVLLHTREEDRGRAISPQYDHPWLEEVRLLALADVAARFGMKGEEEENVEAFFHRQPLLLEPEHAFAFRLVKAQSGLKEEARRHV